ncbi:Clp protease N-terminal domain-containing protein [Acrocarpospora sp. B8E8]|uniref:Clp protease N-terminal domain-containing protein n=1 Tax=Acrocarpospora sp. B8E8 TaxID=3153572 RepID=UPI00325E55C5
MFERFTPEAHQVVVQAQVEARRLGHRFIGTEHVLLALLADPESPPAIALRGIDHAEAEAAIRAWIQRPSGEELDADLLGTLGIDLDAVREKIEASFGPGSLDRAPYRTRRGALVSGRHLSWSAKAKKALELSLREALALKSKEINTTHMLLGLIREGSGLAMQILVERGLNPSAIAETLRARPA